MELVPTKKLQLNAETLKTLKGDTERRPMAPPMPTFPPGCTLFFGR